MVNGEMRRKGLPVNVTVENLGPCKKLLRFELEAKEVDEAFEATLKDFQRQANFPGFRPGKAPREVVLRKYEKEIQEETKRKLRVDNYRKGVQDQKLTVLGYPDFEEIQFKRGEGSQFAATVETTPEFELPEYRGLPAKREMATVSEEDLERAFTALRTQQASFQKADRPVQEGDIAVINYTGACEGKPITELAPVAKGLTEKKNFWIEIKPDSFIPGFAPQLLGAKAGDQRTVAVDFSPDFITKEVAGKKGQYEVEIVEVKERALPPLDDAFAQKYGAKGMPELREGVRRDLQNELNQRQRHSIRNQVIGALLGKAHIPDLPESLVQAETKNVAIQIVSENEQRGVSTEVIQQQKDSIYSAANQTAKDRIKADFLFGRIARKEGIAATPEELTARITTLAHTYNMAPQAFLKELEKRRGMAEVEMQIAREKVIDFLAENARIEDVAPTSY
jgi:trigger factor